MSENLGNNEIGGNADDAVGSSPLPHPTWPGAPSPAAPGPFPDRICKHCGTPIVRHKGERAFPFRRRRFCGLRCAAFFRGALRRDATPPRICANPGCGKTATRAAHYCCRACTLAVQRAGAAEAILANKMVRIETAYDFIAGCAERGAVTPTLTEIAAHAGIVSHTSAHNYIEILIADGRIERRHAGGLHGGDLIYVVPATGKSTTLRPIQDATERRYAVAKEREWFKSDEPDDPKPESLLREEAIAELYAGRRYEDDPLACLPMRKLTMPRPEPGYVPTRSSAEWGAW